MLLEYSFSRLLLHFSGYQRRNSHVALLSSPAITKRKLRTSYIYHHLVAYPEDPKEQQTAHSPPPRPQHTSSSTCLPADDCRANGTHGISPFRSKPTLLILHTTSRNTAAPHARQAMARPRLMPMLAAISFSRRRPDQGAELGFRASANDEMAAVGGIFWRHRCISLRIWF
ncbi:hypothetical protein MCOR25_003564 [Pyricularia grisea]|nr:hypothetical protein MCOR25_003564 [Pyricularia grisea]